MMVKVLPGAGTTSRTPRWRRRSILDRRFESKPDYSISRGDMPSPSSELEVQLDERGPEGRDVDGRLVKAHVRRPCLRLDQVGPMTRCIGCGRRTGLVRKAALTRERGGRYVFGERL